MSSPPASASAYYTPRSPSTSASAYYVPQPSRWPIVGACALLLCTFGAAVWINRGPLGAYVLAAGAALLVYMLFGWFGALVRESEAGLYNAQVDGSYRWAMGWFIFSETMFFAAFFAALIYIRWHSVPDLASGATSDLWPGFTGGWPVTGPGIDGKLARMHPTGVPLLNTILLLTSAATLLWAHRGLQKGARGQLKLGLIVTIALGVVFLCLQMSEHYNAYTVLKLKLDSGAYGATFYLLTGFHGLHVAVGATLLSVILARAVRGDFSPKDQFAFQAASWYWSFVDVVWLLLYVLVYWL